MKQVPTCEYFPYEAVRTNVEGAENIVWAIESNDLPVEAVVGISTDKACKPVNVMGMTKAVQERVFIQGNMRCNGTRFVGVRYGNVLASRGSVIPLFHDQIRRGGPVTVTTAEMTRFLLSLDAAVDTVFAAIDLADPGEILVPDVPAALVINIAEALIDGRDIATVVTGIRPGEKTHEIMISEEEAPRTVRRDRWIAIRPMLPELLGEVIEPVVTGGVLVGDHRARLRRDEGAAPSGTTSWSTMDRERKPSCSDEDHDGARHPSRDHPAEPHHSASRSTLGPRAGPHRTELHGVPLRRVLRRTRDPGDPTCTSGSDATRLVPRSERFSRPPNGSSSSTDPTGS